MSSELQICSATAPSWEDEGPWATSFQDRVATNFDGVTVVDGRMHPDEANLIEILKTNIAATREKLEEASGPEKFSDDELLTFLLMHILGPVHAGKASVKLLARFGCMAGVMSATLAELEEALSRQKTAVSLIIMVRECISSTLRQRATFKLVISRRKELIDYIRFQSLGCGIQRVMALYIDSDQAVISHEVVSIGSANRVDVYPREIVRRVIELNAVSLIIVRTVPNDNVKVTDEDMSLSRDLASACSLLGCNLNDFLVISNTRFSVCIT